MPSSEYEILNSYKLYFKKKITPSTEKSVHLCTALQVNSIKSCIIQVLGIHQVKGQALMEYLKKENSYTRLSDMSDGAKGEGHIRNKEV